MKQVFPYKEVESSSNETPRELDRRMTRLAEERGALFEKAGNLPGLSSGEQQRLKTIERELDECFLARRRQRARYDAHRFSTDYPVARRPSKHTT